MAFSWNDLKSICKAHVYYWGLRFKDLSVQKRLRDLGIEVREAREDELSEIFRLNHDTFARETGQYDLRPDGLLEDRFHGRNYYVIARKKDEIVGAVVGTVGEPFSLEAKLPDKSCLDAVRHRSLGEVRLLAVKRDYRGCGLYPILVAALIRIFVERKSQSRDDGLLIAAYENMAESYKKIGAEQIASAFEYQNKRFVPLFIGKTTPIYLYAYDLEKRRIRRLWKRL